MDELKNTPDVKKLVADLFEQAKQQEKLKGWIAQIAPTTKAYQIKVDNTVVVIYPN